MSMPATALEAQHLAVRVDGNIPVLVVPPEPDFEGLRVLVRERLGNLLPLMGGRACRLDLGEREIENFELRRLLHLLRDEYSIAVTGLYVLPETIHQYAERELKLRLFPLEPPVVEEDVPEPEAPEPVPEVVAPGDEGVAPEDEVVEPEEAVALPAPAESEAEETTVQGPAPAVAFPEPGRRTLYVHRTLRSGASVRFEGDIVVMGDVNPGAQVIGAGNVLVLGALKGLAHAGAAGDEDAFILAFELRPTQLRIARKIAITPQRSPDARFDPEVARIEGDHLVVEPYRPRSSR